MKIKDYNNKSLVGFILTLSSLVFTFLIPLPLATIALYFFLGGIVLGTISIIEIKRTGQKGLFFSIFSVGSLLWAIINVVHKMMVLSKY